MPEDVLNRAINMWRLACALLLLCLVSSGNALATQLDSDLATWRGVWQGRFVTITVLARGHTISEMDRQTQPWWRWGNTETDSYLFYWSDDRLVDLVLDFAQQDGRSYARLYAPNLQEQRIAIRAEGGRLELPKDMRPTVMLWPRQGGWLSGGQPNFDLEMDEQEPSGDRWHWSIGAAKPGSAAWTTRTRIGASNDGQPKFGAAIYADPSVEYELNRPLLPSWPYLSIGSSQVSNHYDKYLHPLLFDPRARVVVHKWLGFHTAGMYQINSLSYPPLVDFESPFAFYRFDPNAGRHANLVIRADIWPKNDRLGPPVQAQRTALRMTWTDTQSDLWRYSLTVAGDHAMTERVRIGNSEVLAVSYKRYPTWITAQDWRAVTFVEDTEGEPGSEGIYDYSVEDNFALASWIHGISDTPPTDYHAPLTNFPIIDPRRLNPGLRGEYSLAYNRLPQLYFEPLDRRPHLLYAEGGLWNLGKGQVVRMHNLDNGPVINGWTRERILPPSVEINTERQYLPGDLDMSRITEPGQLQRAFTKRVEEAIYALQGFLLYTGPTGVELRRPHQFPAHSELAPPIDATSWQRFSDQLTPYTNQPRDPHHLKSWLSDFSGPVLRIAGARLRAVRTIPNGFRCVLTLTQGFRPSGDALMPLTGLVAGDYLVRFDGTFHIQPLTPPNLSLTMNVPELTQIQAIAIGVAVRNDGLEDILTATLELAVVPLHQSIPLTLTQVLPLLGEQTFTTSLVWVPPLAGEWVVTPRVSFGSNRLVVFGAQQVSVQPIQALMPAQAVEVSASWYTLSFGLIVLVALVLIATLSAWQLAPAAPNSSSPNEP